MHQFKLNKLRTELIIFSCDPSGLFLSRIAIIVLNHEFRQYFLLVSSFRQGISVGGGKELS